MARSPSQWENAGGSDRTSGLKDDVRIVKQLKGDFSAAHINPKFDVITRKFSPEQNNKNRVISSIPKPASTELSAAVKSGDQLLAWHLYSREIAEILVTRNLASASNVPPILDLVKVRWERQWMLGSLMSPTEILSKVIKRPIPKFALGTGYANKFLDKSLDNNAPDSVELLGILNKDTDDSALSFEACLSKLDEFAKEHPGEPVSPLARKLFAQGGQIAPAVPVATTANVPPLPTRSELEASGQTFEARRDAARQAGGTLKIIDHLREVWGAWIKAGVLTRADLLHADPIAYSSLTHWLRREGNDLKASLGYDIPTKGDDTRSKLNPEAIKEARRIAKMADRLARK